MPTQVRVGGSWTQLAGCKIYSTGAWREILAIKVYAGGAWRDVANFSAPTPPPGGGGGGGGGTPMSLDTSPETQFKSGSGSSLVSAAVTATPSGGVAPYTYAWTIQSSDGSSTINSPTLATTTFTNTGLVVEEPVTPVFLCTATDSLGASAQATCQVTFTRTS